MRRKGFTLIELLVVISIIALLIGILLPALGAARKTAQQMENSARVKGIHSGMVLFAQGNKDNYPGLTSTGTIRTVAVTGNYTSSANGDVPATRVAIMLNNNYFTPEYAQSPVETIPQAELNNDIVATTGHFSFAMMKIVQADLRLNDWAASTNSEAAVISDRNIGSGSGTNAKSVHDNSAWRGSVGYNDNHVEFEGTNLLSTKYTGGPTNTDDDLFADGGASSSSGSSSASTSQGSDAAMVWKDNSSLSSHKVTAP